MGTSSPIHTVPPSGRCTVIPTRGAITNQISCDRRTVFFFNLKDVIMLHFATSFPILFQCIENDVHYMEVRY